jgi:hypothetical protein
MKKKILFTCLPVAFAFAANAETFLIDFNSADTGGYPDSSTWNILAEAGDLDGSALENSSGSTASGITLAYSGDTLNVNTRTGTEVLATAGNAPSWVGSASATSASSDYFYTSPDYNVDSGIFTLAGFTEGDQISFDIWASRENVNSLAYYEYSLDSGITWLGFNVLNSDGSLETEDGWDSNTTQLQYFGGQVDGGSEGRYMNISDLTIGASGDFQIRVSDDADGTYVVLNAMRLTVIPEPSTSVVFLGLLALTLPLIRRNRDR